MIDLTMHIHVQTERGVLVSDDGDEKHAVWLPLSQIEIEIIKGDTVEITLPEWLAIQKELV